MGTTEVSPAPESAEQQTVLVNSSSIKASLSLAEPILFLYGFSKTEQRERPPAILRGSLTLRVTKPTKIKSINLKFRGISRTEWPEGIPPKKIETFESKDIYSHVWPFFSAQLPQAENGSGAHVVQPLENELSAMSSLPRGRAERTAGISPSASRSRSRSNTIDTFNVLRRHATSPSPGPRSGDAVAAKGYRTFQPAEYIYSFELAIPQMLAETIKCNFGHVKYVFELQIDRPGTFKSNLTGTRDLTILRALGMSNLEYSEPIVISRDWEDQLHYEIAIAGKAFLIGSHIPVAFSFVPLAKVRCHRIRIYITEHTEYFCKNRKVHRVEPVHKFLLLEKISERGIHDSLLQDSTDTSNLTAFEFDVSIPMSFKNRRDRLHPNASVGTIKVHHWIKVVLRLSRAHVDPTTGKTKYYEVSIDSPITLLDPRTAAANTLPQYETSSGLQPEHIRPYQEYLDSQVMRPIHLMREPSIAPPPFDEDQQPPDAFPPQYDHQQDSAANYHQRYMAYREHQTRDSFDDDVPHFSEIIWRDDSSDDPPVSPGGPTVGVAEASSPLHTPSTEASGFPFLLHPIDTPTPASAGSPAAPTTPATPASAPAVSPPSVSPGHEPPATEVPASPTSRSSQPQPQPLWASPSAAAPPAEEPANGASERPSLMLDTRRPEFEHPYLPLSPHSASAGFPYRPLSAASNSSLHGASRGPSRPGSSLRDARPRMGSATSLRTPRYYRQSSMVSVDLIDQATGGSAGRRTSRVANLSEVEDVTDWYPNSRNGSVTSLSVSVLEYERPDQNPLLNGGRAASMVSADLADIDYEDDVASIYSNQSAFIRPQPYFYA